MTSKEPFVFVSYSSRNEAIVRNVISRMEQTFIPYWKAPEHIPAGSNYAREIPKAISECSVFLLLISEESENSIWVEKEVDCAINNRKHIVPLKLMPGEPGEVFRFYLNNVQTIPYYENEKEALDLLVNRLWHLLGMEHAENKEKTAKPERKPCTKRKKLKDLTGKRLSCEYCGGELSFLYRGTYQCKSCGKLNYDDYQKVRNYLEENGPKTMVEIEEATGISSRIIGEFLRDEKLQVPRNSSVMLRCQRCGAGIRTGTFCERCKGIHI